MSETRNGNHVAVSWESEEDVTGDRFEVKSGSVEDLRDAFFENYKHTLNFDDETQVIFYQSDNEHECDPNKPLDFEDMIPDEYFYDPSIATATRPPTLWIKLPSADRNANLPDIHTFSDLEHIISHQRNMSEATNANHVTVSWKFGEAVTGDCFEVKSRRVEKLRDAFFLEMNDTLNFKHRSQVIFYQSDNERKCDPNNPLDWLATIPNEYFHDPSTATATRPPTLWVKLPSAPSGLAPRFPPTTPTGQGINRNMNPPPSTGTATPNLKMPSHSPSNVDGKEEGLKYASDDDVKCMQATSHPACIKLLRLYEEARAENQEAGNPAAPYITKATSYVIKARKVMNGDSLAAIGSNESFFTGAMTKAMNAVLGNGYVVTHQECLGNNNTHSDISACRIEDGQDTRTLMVGEAKWSPADTLRNETRGQIFNKLLRHRIIDSQMDENTDSRPILVLAFDKTRVEIDLAFPSTKDGNMERSHYVSFPKHNRDNEGKEEARETFWTVRLFRIPISEGEATTNLPHLFRFLPKALDYLSNCPYKERVQHKMPFISDTYVHDKDAIGSSIMYNDNVTVIVSKTGTTRVYKEYCYHLRGDETETEFGMIPDSDWIEKEDQRQPPPRDLLDALGEPYTGWNVEDGPFGTSVLEYDFIEGSTDEPTAAGWLMILKQIQRMHSIGYVHGDLLPQNVIFTKDDKGYVIDFDLARKEDEPYVSGLNFNDFSDFRHRDTNYGGKMKKDHDVHALRQMSRHFFDIEFDNFDKWTLDQLIQAFEDNGTIDRRNDHNFRVNTEKPMDTGRPAR